MDNFEVERKTVMTAVANGQAIEFYRRRGFIPKFITMEQANV